MGGPSEEPGVTYQVVADPSVAPGSLTVVVSGWEVHEGKTVRAALGPNEQEAIDNPYGCGEAIVTGGQASFLLMQPDVDPPQVATSSPGWPVLMVGVWDDPALLDPAYGVGGAVEFPDTGEGILVTVPVEALQPLA